MTTDAEIEARRAQAGRAQRLAAAIADAETQYAHFQAERVRLWAVARADGWTFDQIAGAAGVHRTGVYASLKRAGLLVPTRAAKVPETDEQKGEVDA